MSEVSWDFVQDVRDVLAEGEDVRVKILTIDRYFAFLLKLSCCLANAAISCSLLTKSLNTVRILDELNYICI